MTAVYPACEYEELKVPFFDKPHACIMVGFFFKSEHLFHNDQLLIVDFEHIT